MEEAAKRRNYHEICIIQNCLQILFLHQSGYISLRLRYSIGGIDYEATGIVRRIDDLGRVVIPKEIRRTMRICEGDPLEIYTSKGRGYF